MTYATAWSGILNLAKPEGVTSRDAVDAVQRLVRPAKVGHAGTLDPLATGVLLVCIGSATRMVPYLQEQRKHYRARFRLGQTSDTDDSSGKIIATCEPVQVSRDDLTTAFQSFVGRIAQVPPQVSAVHVAGRRAYKLAREGQEFRLEPRLVEVDAIELREFDGTELIVDIVCSSGTYVRSIGRDLGAKLGCGALMTALERTAIGPFALGDAVPLAELTRDRLRSSALPLSAAIPHLPRVTFSVEGVEGIRCGRAAVVSDAVTLADGAELAIIDDEGRLVGIGVWKIESKSVQPRIVFPAESGT